MTTCAWNNSEAFIARAVAKKLQTRLDNVTPSSLFWVRVVLAVMVNGGVWLMSVAFIHLKVHKPTIATSA